LTLPHHTTTLIVLIVVIVVVVVAVVGTETQKNHDEANFDIFRAKGFIPPISR
jgi:hypothetical protein